MARKEKNIIAKRLIHSYLSSIISISLVLLLIGIFGVIAINAQQVSKYFKENVKVTAILKEDVAERKARDLEKKLAALPAIKATTYVSKEQGTRELKKMLGEDFMEAFDINPVPVSIELNINAAYFSADSLNSLEKRILMFKEVEEVSYQHSIVEVLNRNIEKVGIIFLVFIGLLTFISFVLINNTVRLNVYSKRFSIYTMRLVGATRGFIRAPFLWKAILQGMLSGLLAVLYLLGILHLIREEFSEFFTVFDMQLIAYVLAGVVALGAIICWISTLFVINKLVSLNNDDLYY